MAEETEADAPLPAPVWNRAHTAQALANLANVVAGLEDRVAALEAQVKKLTHTLEDWSA